MNFGQKTSNRVPKKPSALVSDTRDVGQALLNQAIVDTACDIKKYFPIIRNHIDVRWGLNEDSWFRSMRGAFWSHYDGTRVDREKALAELGKIESLIPPVCRTGLFFAELENRHQYVYDIIHNLVKSEAQKFGQVSGSTIDNVMNEEKKIADLSSALSRFINIKAKWRFFYERYTMLYGEPLNPNKVERYDSEIYYRAFYSSINSREELEALQNSQAMKSLPDRKWVTELYMTIERALQKLKYNKKA
jgi:hypothetical protein